jgi:hypothetical protein
MFSKLVRIEDLIPTTRLHLLSVQPSSHNPSGHFPGGSGLKGLWRASPSWVALVELNHNLTSSLRVSSLFTPLSSLQISLHAIKPSPQ